MKAMVLAAGLGTRLRPLTADRPKALVEVAGRTMLDLTLTRLRTFGITEVIVNVHHFADMVVDYLRANQNFGMRIEISREEELLDTGGGLKKAAWFFLNDTASSSAHPGDPFILHNVDVLSTIDLASMASFHTEHDALATLAVQNRPTSRYLLFDDKGHLRARQRAAEGGGGVNAEGGGGFNAEGGGGFNAEGGGGGNAEGGGGVNAEGGGGGNAEGGGGFNPRTEPSESRGALAPEGSPPATSIAPRQGTASAGPQKPAKNGPGFSPCGTSTLETAQNPALSAAPAGSLHPLAFNGIHILSPRIFPLLTETGPFSIIDAYLRLAAQGEIIHSFPTGAYYWRDLGRPANIEQATHDIAHGVYPSE